MSEIEYKESSRYPGYYTAYRNGQACGFVSKDQMEINETYQRRKAEKQEATND